MAIMAPTSTPWHQLWLWMVMVSRVVRQTVCLFLMPTEGVTFGSASTGTVSVKMNDVVQSTASANTDSQTVKISFSTGTLFLSHAHRTHTISYLSEPIIHFPTCFVYFYDVLCDLYMCF